MMDSASALEVATNIGQHLCRTAYRHGDVCNWMGMTQDVYDNSDILHFTYRTLGTDLYGGTSGVALFLAELYRRTGEPIFGDTAAGAMTHALDRAHEDLGGLRFGFYSGTVGVAYAATRVADAVGRSDLMTRASEHLDTVGAPGEGEYRLDIIAGAAGGIPALLVMAESLGRPDLRELSCELGRQLVAFAIKDETGWAWEDRAGIEFARPLTGFSHGAAGIGWSLSELHRETGDPEYLDAALNAFRYENQWFQPEHDNWPDFRETDGTALPAPLGVAWCHGAPGIALSRLNALQATNGPQHRKDVEAAVRTMERALANREVDRDFCLCHGMAGLGECLLRAAQAVGNVSAGTLVLEKAEEGALRFGADPQSWPCGVRRGGNPSLMMGVAGIGYFFLGLADPDLPSVLLVRSRPHSTG